MMGALVPLAGSGCDYEEDEDESPPSDDPGAARCADSPPRASIGTNHGHRLQIPREDVETAQPKSYDIRGSSGHPHTVNVSAADFSALSGGGSISLTSSNDAGHTHTVTLSCA